MALADVPVIATRALASLFSMIKDKKYFFKLSVFLKIVLQKFTAKYNINHNLMLKPFASVRDWTHMCISQWDFSHNSWVRKKMFL